MRYIPVSRQRDHGAGIMRISQETTSTLLTLAGKKAEYSTPSLSVLGAVTDLTASGSNNQKENPGMVGPTFNMV